MTHDRVRTILFISNGNAARGQIAAAVARRMLGSGFRILGGGRAPSPLDDRAVAIMREVGVDISGSEPTPLALIGADGVDIVICLDADKTVPDPFSRCELLHWPIPPVEPDAPLEQALGTLREARRTVEERIKVLARVLE